MFVFFVCKYILIILSLYIYIHIYKEILTYPYVYTFIHVERQGTHRYLCRERYSIIAIRGRREYIDSMSIPTGPIEYPMGALWTEKLLQK